MNAEKYKPWVDSVCKKLKDGNWQEVLDSLGNKERYEGCVNLYHYIYENRDYIHYSEYEKNGNFIGSGAIESGNKVVLQKRLKQAGMR